MLRITGMKVLEPDPSFLTSMEKRLKKEITLLEKEYRDRNFHLETVGFRARGDDRLLAQIKFSYIPVDFSSPDE